MNVNSTLLPDKQEKEKHNAALSSVLAAIFLTSMKLVVGIMTGSLGILSEAAHSGLDLVAAAVTFFAVRLAGRPADSEHTYGHGKIENLSALFETLLLLITCGWIVSEAIRRLFFHSVVVEVSFWSFLIMFVSILVDFTRSNLLSRVAKKYNSQALEADALHFSTDIWSSSVVIAGLTLVWLSRRTNLPWLAQADAVAAIGVAGIVVYVSLQLGRRAIGNLIDEISPDMVKRITRAAQIPGVLEVRDVRARQSGPETFVDLAICVSKEATFEQAHSLAAKVESAVQKVAPQSVVMVHMDPISDEPSAEKPVAPRRRRERKNKPRWVQDPGEKKFHPPLHSK